MKFTLTLLALITLLAACQSNTEPTDTLPTLAVLPDASATASVVPTEALTAEVTTEATSEVTESVEESATPAALPTETFTPTATLTRTPRPVTATHTVEPTLAAVGTATQAVLEAPRYSTFTPMPAGTATQAVANVVADVIINEAQFQEEVNRNILAYPSMHSAVVDFVPGAINVQMTTVDGSSASITGARHHHGNTQRRTRHHHHQRYSD